MRRVYMIYLLKVNLNSLTLCEKEIIPHNNYEGNMMNNLFPTVRSEELINILHTTCWAAKTTLFARSSRTYEK